MSKGTLRRKPRRLLERARLLIEQAEALGEPPEDPLLLFSVLYGFWVANIVAFNGDAVASLRRSSWRLPRSKERLVPLMIGHRLMGASLLCTGDSRGRRERTSIRRLRFTILPSIVRWRRDLAKTLRVAILSYRSLALWLLGYPEAALADAEHALQECARDRPSCHVDVCADVHGSDTISSAEITRQQMRNLDEACRFGGRKGRLYLEGVGGMLNKVGFLALTGKASDAVQMITSGIDAHCGQREQHLWLPLLSYHILARAYAELGQFDDAWRCIGEAMTAVETTKERWCEAEVHRIAGEIALKSPEPDAAKAEAYFERALAVARQQQAKSWELRAAMSLARLWRDQGKVQQARELLAPVYGWFTEGFDTRDLKEAKALLEELAV